MLVRVLLLWCNVVIGCFIGLLMLYVVDSRYVLWFDYFSVNFVFNLGLGFIFLFI